MYFGLNRSKSNKLSSLVPSVHVTHDAETNLQNDLLSRYRAFALIKHVVLQLKICVINISQI